MKLIIKKVYKSGNAGGINLAKAWIGKEVIVLPISYKLLAKRFLEYIKNEIKPELKEILTEKELTRLRSFLEREEELATKNQQKKFIADLYLNLEKLQNDELGDILHIFDQTNQKIPKRIYNKIWKEWKKP